MLKLHCSDLLKIRCTTAPLSVVLLTYTCLYVCLQCFDAVGWAAGRASGAGVVICLRSEVQTSMWPS